MVMKNKARVSVHQSVATVPDELMFDILSMFHGGGKRRRYGSDSEGMRDQNLSNPLSNSLIMLPNELLWYILSRLPGKQLMQLKTVCKFCLSILKDPSFLRLARNRSLPSLILHVDEDINNPTSVSYLSSTIFRLKEPSTKEEKSTYLVELRTDPDIACRIDGVLTEVVNGLVCYYDSSNLLLTLFNVCTGEDMRILVPMSYTSHQVSSTHRFHLGYDPTIRVYKLLCYGIQPEGWHYRIQAEIMTLMPPSSGSVSTWRKVELDNNFSCGHISTRSVSTGDGFLWFLSHSRDSLISFDLNKEKFKVIKLQEHVVDKIRSHGLDRIRGPGFSFIQSMGCPAIRIAPELGSRYFTLYLFDNDESNGWKTHHVQWPEKIVLLDQIVDMGNLPTGEILWMNKVNNNQELCGYLYSYNHRIAKFDRFLVGDVQGNALDVVHGSNSISAKISCLDDWGSPYLPLDDVLSLGSCVMK